MKLTRYQKKRLNDPQFKIAFKAALIQFICERLTQTPSVHEEDFEKGWEAFIDPRIKSITFMFPIHLAEDDRVFMPMLFGRGIEAGLRKRKIAKHWLPRLFGRKVRRKR